MSEEIKKEKKAYFQNKPDIGNYDFNGFVRGSYGSRSIFKSWKNWYSADEQLPVYVSETTDTVYTRKSILSLCEEQEAIAEDLFLALDGKTPETLWKEWKKNNEVIKCKCCGKFWNPSLTDNVTRQNLCPYCGTKEKTITAIETVSILLCFAMLTLLIGIGIVVFSKENTLFHDIGMVTVILSGTVGAICQIVLLINRFIEN